LLTEVVRCNVSLGPRNGYPHESRYDNADVHHIGTVDPARHRTSSSICSNQPRKRAVEATLFFCCQCKMAQRKPVAQKTGARFQAARCCKSKCPLKAPPRRRGRFPSCLGRTFGLLAAGLNADSRRRTEGCGSGTSCKPLSPGGRIRNILWLITTLVIGLLALPCRPGSVACETKHSSCPRHESLSVNPC